MAFVSHRSLFFVLLISAAASLAVWAADPPDTLTLTDGERLTGKLVRVVGTSVTFHSDAVGDVTVDWSKVKELTTSGKFAVIPKGFAFKRNETDGRIPVGSVSVTDQKIQVSPGNGAALQTFETGKTGYVVEQGEYEKARKNPSFVEDWKGSMTAGVSLIEATQTSETLTGAVHLARAIPAEDWLAARNRTLINFTASYGKLDQPNTPEIKTDLLHFDAERDEYFSARAYFLGQAAFDHNFSQGLDLQQTYSGGAGWTVMKSDAQTLDLKATASYINQKFSVSSNDKDLVGSIFNESYHRKLPLGIVFDQQITFTPAWNNTSAYAAAGGAGITMALYKRLSLNLSLLDTFLNDPPPGFKKNSFQFTTGVSYTLP